MRKLSIKDQLRECRINNDWVLARVAKSSFVGTYTQVGSDRKWRTVGYCVFTPEPDGSSSKSHFHPFWGHKNWREERRQVLATLLAELGGEWEVSPFSHEARHPKGTVEKVLSEQKARA